jgi:hypothetical protein
LVRRLDDLLAIEVVRMADGCDGIDEAVVAHERAVVLCSRDLAGRDRSDHGRCRAGGGRQEEVAAAFAAAGVTRFETVREQPAPH